MRSLFLALMLIAPAAWAASFQGRTEFTATPIEGKLSINCEQGFERDWRLVTCEELTLDPFEYGYFNAETGVGADEVIITSQRADGKTVKKTVGYDSEKGQSAKRVNLWIETLFQTALLDVGTNRVSYELRKDGQSVASSQFDVVVKTGQRRICPSSLEFSSSMDDCRFPDMACRRYFARYNYCQ